MDQVSEVRGKIDLVNLISSYIPLKKLGNNFKTTCPFHNEKSPSFVVSPERQIWHCFGCQKGGDCFSFLMEYEHMEFPEALRILADKAGVTLINNRSNFIPFSKKEEIYKLNAISTEFYHYILTQHSAGKKALEYLESRGIKMQTAKTYMLGFAPKEGNALVKYLLKKKKPEEDSLFEAGLAIRKFNGIYDFFQNRIMFPLYDHRDNIIGFSGRVFTNELKGPKYINTKETLVYHKGSVFFGLNMAKTHIKKEDKAIIMEGEFDVISAFQTGIVNAIAIKGTALTRDQVNLLSRFTTKVALCLDGDSAGQEALKRSLAVLEDKNFTTSVIAIPSGKDPDESIKKDPTEFKKAVKNDIPIYDFLLELLLKKNSVTTSEGKKNIGEEMLSHISRITNEIVKEHYLRILSKTIQISQEALEKQMARSIQKETINRKTEEPQPIQRLREEKLEEYFVALIVQSKNPKTFFEKVEDFLKLYQWTTPSLGKILEKIITLNVSKDMLIKSLENTLYKELLPYFDRCFLLPLPVFRNDEEYKKEFEVCTNDLLTLSLKKQIKQIVSLIEEQEKNGNVEQIDKLQEQLALLTEKLGRKNR